MSAEPDKACLLDLTRLVSRAGKGLTGVDLVELAYLRALVADRIAAFGLVRTSLGYILLDEAGMTGLAERIEGRVAWGPSDRLSKIFSRLDKAQKRAQSDMRRLARARAPKSGLRRMLARHLPQGTSYFNVGHTNLTDRVVHAVCHGLGGQIVVMVHDTIPLDHPLYQRPEAVTRFRAMLKQVSRWADLVIYNSRATRRDAERHFEEIGKVPPGLVALLGVELAEPRPDELPTGLPPEGVYFVTVGTLEPRKNHTLLLEIWERMVKQTVPQDMPHLVICGQRGWMNEELFYRLDHSPLKGQHIHEYAGLSDGAIAALLEGAAGALYPSFAEGFGLPAAEAAARGVPVICAELPATREVLGDIPVYASLKDSYLWQRRITSLAEGHRAGRSAGGRSRDTFEPPTWDAHFNAVLKMA
ncbi:glycosyltransferase family 4 protein [Marimonas lutisalis]|uniref:glycosyltransferase family 4 protein n=1 Tax=Marimonas lutisalis TaxID=2545756 RepID=UPI0010F84ABE|nr:glycosyltransferase family 1 protein [Marimonas lutisalis]